MHSASGFMTVNHTFHSGYALVVGRFTVINPSTLIHSQTICEKVPNLSWKPLAFSLPNRLPTITIGYCFINHHKPTALCYHGNNFGYVVAYSFAYTIVSADFQLLTHFWYSTLQTGCTACTCRVLSIIITNKEMWYKQWQ